MLSFKNNKLVVIAFLFPAIAIYILLMISPVFVTACLSMFKWTGVGGSVFEFIGFGNYQTVVSDSTFLESWGRLLYFIVLSLITQLGLGFILAQLVSLGLKGSRFFKLSFFIPVVLSVTAVSLMWKMILSTNYGMINEGLKVIGLEFLAKSWLTDPSVCFTVITLVNTWVQMGMIFVILFAGIVNIPVELFEAAAIDGINGWNRVFKMTIPLIKDVIAVCTILILSNSMKAFDVFFVMTGGSFGPGEVNMVPMGLMYNISFRYNDFGRGSVIALLVMIVGAIVSALVYFRGFNKNKG